MLGKYSLLSMKKTSLEQHCFCVFNPILGIIFPTCERQVGVCMCKSGRVEVLPLSSNFHVI